MRVLVFAHRLELGGTQTNAIDLSAALRSRGHEVVLFATPGPALDLVRAAGLDFIEAPSADHHPSIRRGRALRRLVREFGPDVIHVWDWPQCLDAFYAVHLPMRIPILCTVMSMVVPRIVPGSLAVTFGTEELVASARRSRSSPVDLLEPPVDIVANAPGAIDPAMLAAQFGLGDGRQNVVVVSRLVSWLKLEGIRRAIAAVDELSAEQPVRLLIAGEGPAEAAVEAAAEEVNRRRGAGTIVLTGGLVDPRPAYAAADVMLGMGGSALRAMAFAKPLVVLGERGFSCPLTEVTAPIFLWQGYYGLGDGVVQPDPLVGQIRSLLDDAVARASLGWFGRELVEQRYGVEAAADRLEASLAAAVREPSLRRDRAAAAFTTAAVLAKQELSEARR
jgi:glycosyltransferase involved in cell wall biosynthesis